MITRFGTASAAPPRRGGGGRALRVPGRLIQPSMRGAPTRETWRGAARRCGMSAAAARRRAAEIIAGGGKARVEIDTGYGFTVKCRIQ